MQAAGVLRNLTSGAQRPFQTNPAGVYHFDAVPLGRYQLEVRKPGFATQIEPLELTSAYTIARTLTLSLRSQETAINVVAVTPLPGSDVPLDQIPSPVQTASAKQLENGSSLDLSDFLNRHINSVYVNENQENPFQPDINYRGYTASPLLGTPQGLSVYMDGARQNQPFGDIVAWDLIPEIAIEEMTLMPGSNPLYGLNTLGGALSIQTKDGLSHPGTSIQASGGQYGRRAVEAEHGGSNAKGLNWYFAGNLYREDGWRQYSPSEVRQIFGKLGWTHGKTVMGLSFSYADNWLTGNGLQDFRFLQQNYASVYSIPDITWNRSPSFKYNVQHELTPNLTLSGVAYYRYIRADTTNGDFNSNSFDESLYNLSKADIAALTAAGYKGFPLTGNATTEPFPYWRCLAQGLEGDEPVEKCDGVITNTWTKQNNWGLSGLASWRTSRNHFTVGTAWDHSSLTFQQAVQFAYINPNRVSLTPVPFFADGSSNSNGIPVDDRAYLHGIINTPSFYATDTLSLGKWNFTFSGRYDHTSVNNLDRLPPGFASTAGSDGGRASLTSYSTYGRFNPAAGLTYTPSSLLSFYFSYSEGSRAPSSTEIGCSNPNDPCNLPNALVSDPPLKQVVSRTLEAGVRSAHEGSLRWSAGWFRGINYNDLLFVSSEQTGFGYFTNFGKTERTGVEASISQQFHRVTMGANYTFMNATYQSPQTIDGGSNSANQSAQAGYLGVDDDITISAGDRIPQTPQHLGKAWADYQPFAKVNVDLDFRAVSRSYARGNENNQDKPDGVYYLGPGSSPGYGVTDLGVRYQLSKHIQLFMEINNLLDHHYYTAAQLGPTPFDNNGNFIARPFAPIRGGGDGNYPIRTTTFYAPGTPIDVFGGMKFTF
jgi:outer membrane receptor protein involved in Fe transport